MNSDNPASRLYSILVAAKGVQPDQTQRVVWRHVLQMKNPSDSQLYAQLGKLMALPEQISQWLAEKYPSKNWVAWKSSVDKAFSQIHLNGQWASSANLINDRALTELDMISTLYEAAGGMKSISHQEIEAFLEKINKIKAEVLSSEMSDQMKKTFLNYLNKILDALESYHITGAAPVMEAVEAAIGHVVVDSDYADSLKRSGAGEQLVTFIGSLVDAVASVQGLPPMATPFLQLIRSK